VETFSLPVFVFLERAATQELQSNRDRWRRWASKNPLRLRATALKWRQRNRAKLAEQSRQWAARNRKLRREIQRRYRAAHPEQTRALRRGWAARKHATPRGRLDTLLRNRVREAIVRQKGAKTLRTRELLGCTVEQVRTHLEQQFRPGMAWENLGSVWQIDHRRPCASFDLTNPDQQRQCFHYSNLQPLFAFENMSKGARILDVSS
jgi:hypothetical protein